MTRLGGLAGLLLALASAPQHAADPKARNLVDLSLEDLGKVEVTSVSGRAERLSDAPASIYVISGEDIRRSGVTSLPEALRLAPNLNVARVDAGQYAITARGFNNAIGNKLLVLIDGRTVYSPFFSGVFWDQQDVMLEDVERIEVISGPGSTIWGANAVNGVINVVTRAAADTQGALLVLGGGNREAATAFRYGAPLGAGGSFRLYGKTSQVQNTRRAAGTALPDGGERNQVGFRADWLDANGGLTLQGDTYRMAAEHRGFFGAFELRPIEAAGANLLARWTRRFADGSNLHLQAYYDYSNRDDALQYRPEENVVDVEFKHGLAPRGAHRILWGGGYRNVRDHIQPGLFFGFVPPKRSLMSKNLFLQDEIRLHESIELTVGAKLQTNDYTGLEVLPSVRLAVNTAPNRLLWGAVSRAVRAPARLDRDIRLPPAGPPFFIAGGDHFQSEVARVLEIGYRAQPSSALSYSVTFFHHEWDKLRSGQNPPNAQVQNRIAGDAYGMEAWGAWRPTQDWRLSGGLTTLRKDLRHNNPVASDPTGIGNLGNDPEYQWTLRSAFNLPHRQELDIALRHVAALPNPGVPRYTAVDLRYAWRVRPELELSVTAQNLFDPGHPEINALPDRSEIERSVFLRLRWTP